MPDSRPEFRTDLRSDPREHLSLEGRRARREINRRRIRMRRFTVVAAKLGLPDNDDYAKGQSLAVEHFPAFPDSVEALKRLRVILEKAGYSVDSLF